MYYLKHVAKLGVLLILTILVACAQFTSQPPSDPAQSEAQQLKEQERVAFERAVLYQKEGKLDEARGAYDSLIKAFPKNAVAFVNLSQIALSEENNEQAKEYIESAFSLGADQSQAYTIAGLIARKSGEFEESEAYYREALSRDPDYLPALLNLAILLDLYRGRLSEALAYYQQAQDQSNEPDPRLKDWIFDIERRIGGS